MQPLDPLLIDFLFQHKPILQLQHATIFQQLVQVSSELRPSLFETHQVRPKQAIMYSFPDKTLDTSLN